MSVHVIGWSAVFKVTGCGARCIDFSSVGVKQDSAIKWNVAPESRMYSRSSSHIQRWVTLPSPSESVSGEGLSFSDDELDPPDVDSEAEDDELSESEDDESSELEDPSSVLMSALRDLNQSAFR